MIPILIGALFDAILTASALLLTFFCTLPALEYHRARWPGRAMALALGAAMPVLLIVLRIGLLPSGSASILLAVELGLLVGLLSWPQFVVRLTGGPRPYPNDAATVVAAGLELWRRFDGGDLDGASEVARQMGRQRTPTTEHYIDAWQRFINEERAGRSRAASTRSAALREVADEGRRLESLPRTVAPRAAWSITILVTLAASSPSLVALGPCIGVEQSLPAATVTPPRPQSTLFEALVTVPEPGAVITFDQAMDLEAAAESRHDPETRGHLVSAGFVAAHTRDFLASDGRRIHADVFDFGDAAGALLFQAAVNRYACQFSNEQFDGPHGAIGLQVRWSRGDPVEEQVSWVVGTRRYLVSVRATEVPADHDRVLSIARVAMEGIGLRSDAD